MATRSSNSTTFELTAPIVWIDSRTEAVGASNKPRTRFRVRIDSQTPYSQDVTFEVFGATVDALRRYAVGDLVRVSFNIREHVVNYPDGTATRYTNLKAWRIEYPEPKPGR